MLLPAVSTYERCDVVGVSTITTTVRKEYYQEVKQEEKNTCVFGKKNVQMVLVNRKPKVNRLMKLKWEREKLERKEAMKRHMDEYKERLMTDKELPRGKRRNVRLKGREQC